MRIISGEHKGRKIKTPNNLPVRPTKDMAKEALFNILNNHFYFDEVHVLDLFSGTGSISYEFASRGAVHIVAVENNPTNLKFINEMVDSLSFPIDVKPSDVYQFLEKESHKYDIIFADPPYSFSDEEFAQISFLVFKNSLLEKNGLLVIEHSKAMDLSALEHYKYSRNYGGSVFSFFGLPETDEEE
ncbi:16S rRNA (guanine(966)-N(2))-methyltransferase RsmD [Flavobacteriaceae bacterium MAR_2010_188]|nr:16S rRNA (guanine(966)-N(2))-methyltransferase RsmD [Flavobacteriaceae bacterium MAR_2010_188]